MAGELTVQDYIRVLLEGEAHEFPCDTCEVSELDVQIPPWFDEEKFKRGQRYILNNLTGQVFLMLSGLISVLAVPSILTILINTRKSSSVEGAYRRYASTILHVYSWFVHELRPGTVTWRSLCAVRIRHLRSRKTSLMRGNGDISQRDLAITQFGFFGVGLLKPHMLGMEHDNREDLEGYVHFWRTIGYMLGIDDRYNVCRPSVDETKEVCQFLCEEVFQKLLYNPPEYFYHMVSELLDGINFVSAIILTKPYIYFAYRLFGVPGFNRPVQMKEKTENIMKIAVERNVTNGLFRSINTSSDNILDPELFYSTFDSSQRFMLKWYVRMLQIWMHSFLGRLFYNGFIRLTLLFLRHFPCRGFWKFGLRTYVDMFAEDISLPGKLRTNREVLDILNNKT